MQTYDRHQALLKPEGGRRVIIASEVEVRRRARTTRTRIKHFAGKSIRSLEPKAAGLFHRVKKESPEIHTNPVTHLFRGVRNKITTR